MTDIPPSVPRFSRGIPRAGGLLASALLATASLGACRGAPSSDSGPSSDVTDGAASTAVGSFVEGFSTPDAATLFESSGPGSWVVSDGAYHLRTGLPGPGSGVPDQPPMSLARVRVAGEEWRLQATATPEAEHAEWSVVFARTDATDYSYVHVDEDEEASGIYVVTEGETTRVAPIAAVATAGATQLLELRRDRHRLKTYLDDGSGLRYVGTAELAPSSSVEPGLGSWGGSVTFDDVVVTTPDPDAPAAPTSEAPAEPEAPSSVPAGPVDDPTYTVLDGTGRAVDVSTSDELAAALADARPGDVITMADGTYTTKGLQAPLVVGGRQYVGTFVAPTSGTASEPILLRGSRAAVIDGKPGEDGTGTQYGLYLAGVEHWHVEGLTVTNVAKGIVLDHSRHTVIEGVDVHDIGQEGIHLRAFSTDNVVRGSTVSRTGRSNETYGEGIYVGSAVSNWDTYTDGRPDASGNNRILDNQIRETTSESMDIKEGTTGGVIRGNTFDGADMTGSWADSWIDMKGNGWLVEGNHGTHALQDGFQVHQAVEGWGLDNVFRGNTAVVDADGYGFWLQKEVTGNLVACDNVVEGAASGFATVPCTSTVPN